MGDGFQRLIVDAPPAVMSLNVQAAMGPVREPKRSQFELLVRHFLERFFNHETASADGDAKTRLVQLAFAAGLPGLMVAVYLWPLYHPVIVYPPHPGVAPGPPPYWVQVNHHFFFVIYSFVVMGLITVFEWDLFFPDLLDVQVMGTLPIKARRVFMGRVAAIGLLIGAFLFDANFLAPIVLPMSTDPPSLMRLEAGHLAAVAGSGLFAAFSIVAAQSVLLALFGERVFRKVSLLLQGGAVAGLVMLLLLFPVLSGVTPSLLQSGNRAMWLFPPYWFLGMYQNVLGGPEAIEEFRTLQTIGWVALASATAIAICAYPIAYVRRVKNLVEGAVTRRNKNGALAPANTAAHTLLVRKPIGRAVFHFINQTLLRLPRYRIYLVLYGGVGLSVLIATVLRLDVVRGSLRAEASADGIRAAAGIVAFWVTVGLRTAFVSSGNQRGGWVFRFTHGRPAHFGAAIQELRAVKVWVLACAVVVTVLVVLGLRAVAPPELLGGHSAAAQLLVGVGLCVILTDAVFAQVLTVPFTGEAAGEKPNIAFILLKFFTFFPFVTAGALGAEMWTEISWAHFAGAALVVLVVHLWFRYRHREAVRINSAQAEVEEGEDEFPMRLGLRY
ncbi:hypothetical protein [Occallatibacter savannae]|uniref:hypothetical protein n=1 Tax=Occallatibacter savannae TaxID=1002691 RepID=UPI000D694663|nr:hypothetical protein [Occallatibacter savannae]